MNKEYSKIIEEAKKGAAQDPLEISILIDILNIHVKPEIILEIGSLSGGTLAYFSEIPTLKTLICIDIKEDINRKRVIDILDKKLKDREKGGGCYEIIGDSTSQLTIENTKAILTESGIRANIVDKAGSLIQQNITEKASYGDLVSQMRNFLTETSEGSGALARYTSQIVTDSLNTYAAEYNRFVSDSLDLKWFVYSGAIVDKSRDFCRALVKKQYVHKSEFGAVAHGNFTPKPKDLKGLKPNTKGSNLQILRGGWNCNHLLTPIAEEFVPKDLRAKFD